MDRIEISGLRAFGRHGVHPEEREHGQTFEVDLVVECDLSAAAVSDSLVDTVDYDALARRVAEGVTTTRFALLEALAAHLAGVVLAEPAVSAVEVRVSKPDLVLPVEVGDVSVVLRRARSGAPGPP
ncbi:MAG TPA: dihydroneopterin aldolase [Egibacteraceae bacterium]|nr:dihydroneopterin aldolase [Egibacteraceae bacterium]